MAVGELAEIFEYLSYSENRAPFMARDSIPRAFVYYAGHKDTGIDLSFHCARQLGSAPYRLKCDQLGAERLR